MTEELFNEEMLSETCSGGCTCAGSVSGFAKPIGSCIKRKKGKKKSKKTESVDAILFKEFILNDMPCATIIDEHSFKHFMNEGKWYMSVDNSLVNTHDKEVMIETFDDIVSGESVDNLLEDYSCYEMDLLMEDGDPITSNPQNPNGVPKNLADDEEIGIFSNAINKGYFKNTKLWDELTPEEQEAKKKYDKELSNDIEKDFNITTDSITPKKGKLKGIKSLSNGDSVAQIEMDDEKGKIVDVSTTSLNKIQ